jgi:hypothetical protein
VARNAAAQALRGQSARTTAKGASANNAAGRASASTNAEEARASNAAGQASASTSALETSSRNAAGRASASTTAEKARASNAGRSRTSLLQATDQLFLPLVMLFKTWFRQGLVELSVYRYTNSCSVSK